MTVRTVPASVGQRLLWLLDHYRDDGGALNESLAWRIKGHLDLDALQRALDALVTRHEALRTTFAGSAGRLLQTIHPPDPTPFTVSDIAPGDGGDQLEDLVRTEVEARIDPTNLPLRVGLWRLDVDDHVLFLSISHLVTDHQSNAIVATDLAAFYSAFAGGTDLDLPMIEWQYADWAEWQRTSLTGEKLARLQAHWGRVLAEARPIELPDFATGAVAGERAYERRRLGADVAGALAGIAEEYDSSPFAVALAAFYVHLYSLTGQSDIVVGSLFANRANKEILHTVGFFVNLLALRGRISPDKRFAEVLCDVTATAKCAMANQELPHHMLPAGTVHAHRVIFQFIEGEPRPAARARMRGLELTPIERRSDRARFTLELFVACAHDHVSPVLLYDRSRVDDTWAAGFADGYARLLSTLASAPTATVGALLS
ncbi:MAG TPA: condensation domain-containing protein [Solirubrobacteraceae bacterium]|jgi:hypothetical protein|nr:condensation domain-containing protein [Solirubrobacteraceae bacterium]